MLQEAIKKIVRRENLAESEAYASMNEIMSGSASPAQIGAFLIGLRMKGETIEEITGCAKAMRSNAIQVKLNSNYAIDTCGTGGDGGKTFNISTAVAIIAASAGVKVAKHGNRAVSSRSGSADVLTELGFNIDLEPEMVRSSIDDLGMGFLFAQKFHTAMKNVGGARRELGTRTIFNILGPLTNPSFVKGQVLGVYDRKLTHVIAEVLLNLGCEKALVVHGADGLDEITTTGVTYISEVIDNSVIDRIINPGELGIPLGKAEDIKGGDSRENAEIILKILQGERGAKRDIVVLNSAAALYVGKACRNIGEGVKLAESLIDSEKAYSKYCQLIQFSRRVS
jgi:anthranilate phosphoribosyltransferase